MRLGEFRSATRDLENKLCIYLSDYKNGGVKKVEIDMATEKCLFLRVIEDEVL